MSIYKVKTYTKLIAMMVVLLVVVIFMASNSDKVKIKFLWWDIWHAPTFALILVSASLGATFILVSRQIRNVISEVSNLRRDEKTRQKLLEQLKQKAKQEQKQEPKQKEKSDSTN